MNRYIQDMEHRQSRYAEYWAKENHDRPIMSITAPKKGARNDAPAYPGTLAERWWDDAWTIARERAHMEATYYAGESLPILNPNLGPDIFAAFLGCELEYGEDTSWAHPFLEDWKDASFVFDPGNRYWKKILSMTEAFLKDSDGDYLVGVTDIHEGMDAIVSMRGPEKVCLDLYDYPEAIHKALDEIGQVFATTLHELYALVAKYQSGTTNWMGIYHPGNWYVTSSDFIYMISPSAFDEFSADSIRLEAKTVGNNIFHLDGISSAKHLDKLLDMPEIHGIQWVYGAGQPTAAHWIDLLKRIQDAGKMIEVNCVPSDMKTLLSCGLKPEGVRYSLHASSEEEADALLREADAAYKRKLF